MLNSLIINLIDKLFSKVSYIQTTHVKYISRHEWVKIMSYISSLVLSSAQTIIYALQIYFSKDDIPEIRRLFPEAIVQHIEGAGHWVHADKPIEFLRAVMDFLDDWR